MPVLWRALLVLAIALPGVGLAQGAAATGEWQWPSRYRAGCCLGAPAGLLADTASDAGAYRLELPDEAKDRAGLRRDTWYFAGYQFAAVAILYVMPESVTGWSAQDKSDYSMSKWWHNVTHPRLDTDKFYINYIVHPYWGSAYFVRARERGYSNMESFWYSAMLSAMFEFGAEALAEPVSYQDLVFTPVLGSMLGMWFMDVRDGIRDRAEARGRRTTGEKWVMALTDPLGGINRQVDKLFGRDVDVRIQPYMALPPSANDPYARPLRSHVESVVGLQFDVSF